MSRVAHVVSRFPKLTETFILYELLEQERQGIELSLYPLLRYREAVAHPEAARLAARAHYLPFLSLPILRAIWHFCRTRPLALVATVAEVLGGTLGSFNFFFGALGILPKSIRFALEMREEGVTHVHAHFATHATVCALIVHRLTGIPYSFTAHGSDLHVDRRMLCRKLEAAAFAVTVSEYNRRLIQEECGERLGRKVEVVYLGVDTQLFSPPAASRSRAEGFTVVCVARFEEVKGHVYLLEACRMLRDRGVSLRCELVGDGPWRRRIERAIRDLGLEDCVTLYGAQSRSQVVERLGRASAFVLATAPTTDGKREGLPVVLMEAMACGLPVIAAAVSGIPELVIEGHTGLLVPPRDARAVADALQRLEADAALRARLGEAGRQRVVEHFDLRRSATRRAALLTGSEAQREAPVERRTAPAAPEIRP